MDAELLKAGAQDIYVNIIEGTRHVIGGRNNSFVKCSSLRDRRSGGGGIGGVGGVSVAVGEGGEREKKE